MSVQLPKNVIVACVIPNQANEGVLSKKCQMQMTIAPTNAGSIAIDSPRQAGFWLTRAYTQTSQMATSHSSTLAM
jgi:hypothetical protein